MGTDIAALLERSGWLLTYGAIFVGGLALNLTPCVYPLIPITVGYFTGQRQTGRVQVAALSPASFRRVRPPRRPPNT